MLLQALKAAARQRAKRARGPFGRLRAAPHVPVVKIMKPNAARTPARVRGPLCCQCSIWHKRRADEAQACRRIVQLLRGLRHSSRSRRKTQCQLAIVVGGIGASAQHCSRQRELARSSGCVCAFSACQLCCRQVTPRNAAAFWNEPENAPKPHACARQDDGVRRAPPPCNKGSAPTETAEPPAPPTQYKPSRASAQLSQQHTRPCCKNITRTPHKEHKLQAGFLVKQRRW